MKDEKIIKLIQQARSGKAGAFEKLYYEFCNLVYYIAYQQLNHNHEDAEDVTQEVMVVINKNITSLKEDHAFKAWLCTITINCCKKLRKKQKQHKTYYLEDLNVAIEEEREEFLPQEVLTSKELKKTVLELIDQLPEDYRTVLLLYYFADITTEEIAEIMDASQHAIHNKLSCARAMIKSKINNKELTKSIMVAPIPFIAQIFHEESMNVCSKQVVAKISNKVLSQKPNNFLILKSKYFSKILVTVVSCVIGLSIYFISNSSSSITEEKVIKEKIVVPRKEPKLVLNLAYFVGNDDALILESWQTMQSGDQHEVFEKLLERHLISTGDVYVDSNLKDAYLIYYLEKDSNRLILIEFYNDYTKDWIIANTITDINQAILTDEDIKVLFQQITSH